MHNEKTRELLAKLTANTNIQPNDCHPLHLNPSTIPPPPPPAQRTVLPVGADWESPSIRVILDAFKESYNAQLKDSPVAKELLPLLRASGSVEVDASMADLFDSGLLGSTNAVKSANERLVQCNHCNRPVLITRILAHVKRCAPGKIDDDETDTEMQLICPILEEENTSTPPKTPPLVDGLPASPKRAKGAVKEEDDWRARITPVVPRYVPRGASVKRRRYALPPAESPAQRKKSVNNERKALTAAASAGITAVNVQNVADTSPTSDDPLRKLAQKWGQSAPWSQIMQTAMPLQIPRNPKKRPVTGKEAQAASAGKGIVYVNGHGPAAAQKVGGKPAESAEKHMTLAQQGPTVLGSLLWLRGQGMKELGNTPLQNMDIPQMPISRSGPVFHGQAYVAALGTFETDPRHQNTIKLPAGTVNTGPASNPPENRANTPSRSTGTDVRAKQPTPQPTMSAANSGSSQAPPAKKQRTAKPQRAQTPTANGQHFAPGVHVRAGQNAARKMTNMRMPSGMTAGRAAPANAQEILQRMQQRNIPQASKGVHALNQNVAGVANAAAAKYAASQALQQKNLSRQGVVGNVQLSRMPPGTVPESTQNANVALWTAANTSQGRPVKNRAHTVVGSASPSIRSTGSIAVKSQSPGQHSTRSTDRTPLRTPAAGTPYDPAVLTAAAAAQAAAGGNRAAAMRAATGNPQLDFQQVAAQLAAARRPGREDAFDPTRGLVPNIAAAHQANNATARLQQAQALRGLTQHQRLKQAAVVQSAIQRTGVGLENRQVQRLRKEEALKKTPGIGRQLQQAEALQKSVAGKLPNGVPFVKPGETGALNVAGSHGFYSAALAVAGKTPAAAAAQNAALKGQPDITQLLGLGHANPNRLLPGQADANAALLQNMHDVHQIQNVPVVPGMRTAAQNNNVLGMLQASALSAGFPNAGLNTAAGAGLGGNVGIPGQNPNVINSEVILQHLFAGRTAQVNPNAALQAQQVARANQLSHAQQLPRTAGIPRPVMPSAQNNAALVELGRALESAPASAPSGIEFDEKDLID